MASAEVGDDVFRDDPTIHELGLDNKTLAHNDHMICPQKGGWPS